jgi:hypothetical protein
MEDNQIVSLISLLGKSKNLAKSLKKIDNKIIGKIIDKLILSFPNQLTELAFKRWIKDNFDSEDFILIEGYCEGKRSTHVNIETISYLEDKLIFCSTEYDDWYINVNTSKQIEVENWKIYPDHNSFINEFIRIYKQCEVNEIPDEDYTDPLKDYFVYYIWKNHSDIIPKREQKFPELNY